MNGFGQRPVLPDALIFARHDVAEEVHVQQPLLSFDSDEPRIRHLLRHFFHGQRLARARWPGQQHRLAAPQTVVDQLRLPSDKTTETVQGGRDAHWQDVIALWVIALLVWRLAHSCLIDARAVARRRRTPAVNRASRPH